MSINFHLIASHLVQFKELQMSNSSCPIAIAIVNKNKLGPLQWLRPSFEGQMNWKTCGVTNVLRVSHCVKKKKNVKKLSKKKKKLSKSCQKVFKKCQKIVKKLSKSCQKVVRNLSKRKKVAKKLSKNCQKVVKKSCQKSCQKVVKKLKKLTKGSAMYHWSFYVSQEAMKRKNQQRWANSSSKAFGISFADRPKAKPIFFFNKIQKYKLNI
jgi:hypothetical protein